MPWSWGSWLDVRKYEIPIGHDSFPSGEPADLLAVNNSGVKPNIHT